MPFDPSLEPPIPLAQLNERIGWLPTKPHVSSWFRYAQIGLRGHRLETLRIPGSGLCSSEAAVRRFIAKITATPNAAPGAGELTHAG